MRRAHKAQHASAATVITKSSALERTSTLRTAAIEEGEPVTFGVGVVSLHAMSRTKSSVNPPLAVPEVTVADT